MTDTTEDLIRWREEERDAWLDAPDIELAAAFAGTVTDLSLNSLMQALSHRLMSVREIAFDEIESRHPDYAEHLMKVPKYRDLMKGGTPAPVTAQDRWSGHPGDYVAGAEYGD